MEGFVRSPNKRWICPVGHIVGEDYRICSICFNQEREMLELQSRMTLNKNYGNKFSSKEKSSSGGNLQRLEAPPQYYKGRDSRNQERKEKKFDDWFP